MLGWSDGGSPGLRATHADRDQLRRVLDIAQGEGRLDGVEHDRRVEAVRVAKTRADLAAVAVDLPAGKGERKWLDDARIRSADRELAAGVLADAAASGRLSAEEYEDRAIRVTEVTVYQELTALLRGLPARPDADPASLRPSDADREAASAELSRSVTDGRVSVAEHESLSAEIGAARRIGQLGELVAMLSRRAADHHRDKAAAMLDTALADGRLDHEQHTARTAKAAEARQLADLAALTEDLSGKARRLSNADRTETAAVLKRALDDGGLDLDEYDARVKAAYEATTVAETTPLLADLVAPPRQPLSGPLDDLFDRLLYNSALLPARRGFWGRLHPKPLWKLWTLGTLAVWIWVIVAAGPILLGLTVGAGWAPVAILVAVGNRIARIGAGDVKARRDAILEDLARTVAERPDVREATAEMEGAKLTVRFKPREDAAGVPASLTEQVIGLAWRSRLRPLDTVVLSNWGTEEGFEYVPLSKRWKELDHRYGRRPYGRMPAEED